MLLETLLKNTLTSDPEYEQIQRSIDAMGELADTINRAIREKQELEEVIAIQHKFKNSAVCHPFISFAFLVIVH